MLLHVFYSVPSVISYYKSICLWAAGRQIFSCLWKKFAQSIVIGVMPRLILGCLGLIGRKRVLKGLFVLSRNTFVIVVWLGEYAIPGKFLAKYGVPGNYVANMPLDPQNIMSKRLLSYINTYNRRCHQLRKLYNTSHNYIPCFVLGHKVYSCQRLIYDVLHFKCERWTVLHQDGQW